MYIWFYRLAAEQWLAWAGKHADVPQDAPLPSGSTAADVLGTLSARERLVFTLKSNQRLTLATVAQIVDLPPETVARIFARAVAKLRISLCP
jgi:DNA-directed RNA polymerase specialized sigma24 family protein